MYPLTSVNPKEHPTAHPVISECFKATLSTELVSSYNKIRKPAVSGPIISCVQREEKCAGGLRMKGRVQRKGVKEMRLISSTECLK